MARLHYRELSAEQIFYEIIKQIPVMEKDEEGTLYDIFGDCWGGLDRFEKRIAEEKLIQVITKQTLKGLVYLRHENGQLIKDNHGDVMFKKIDSDNFKG